MLYRPALFYEVRDDVKVESLNLRNKDDIHLICQHQQDGSNTTHRGWCTGCLVIIEADQ